MTCMAIITIIVIVTTAAAVAAGKANCCSPSSPRSRRLGEGEKINLDKKRTSSEYRAPRAWIRLLHDAIVIEYLRA